MSFYNKREEKESEKSKLSHQPGEPRYDSNPHDFKKLLDDCKNLDAMFNRTQIILDKGKSGTSGFGMSNHQVAET